MRLNCEQNSKEKKSMQEGGVNERRECNFSMFMFVRKISWKEDGALFLKSMGLSSTLDC